MNSYTPAPDTLPSTGKKSPPVNERPLAGLLSQIDSSLVESVGKYNDLLEKSDKEAAAKAGAEAGAVKRGMLKRREIMSRLPQAPRAPEDFKQTPQAPNEPVGDPMNIFKTYAPALAVLAGFATRKPLVTSINALASAMEGYRQGDKDKYERNRQIWQDQTKKALDDNKMMTDRYSLLVDQYKNDSARLNAELNAAALDMQDEKTIAALRSPGGAANAIKRINDMIKLRTELQKSITTQQKLNIGFDFDNLTDEEKSAVDFYALQQIKAPDQTLYQNLGRSAGGAAFVKAIKSRIPSLAQEMGIAPEDLSARQLEAKGVARAQTEVGRILGRIQIAKDTAYGAMDIVKDKLDGVFLSGLPPLNLAINAYETQTGDPNIVAYGTAINTLVNEYGRVIAAGNGTSALADREHARDMLSKAQTKDQMMAVLETMQQEIDNAEKNAVAAPQKISERWLKANSSFAEKASEDYSDEDIEHTAKLYGISKAEVKKRLGIK